MSDEANYFEDLSQECSKEWSGYHEKKESFPLFKLAFQVNYFLSNLLAIVTKTVVTAEWSKAP